jgi:hypothetical protein
MHLLDYSALLSMPKPFSFEPMLCESAERPPEGREWRYELKLDGFRAISRKSGRRPEPARGVITQTEGFPRRFPRRGTAELPSETVTESGRARRNSPLG